MNGNTLSNLGSQIAKNGFRNEKEIVDKFNKWQQDAEAKNWLMSLGHNPTDVINVQAIKIEGTVKTDIQVKINSRTKGVSDNNISIKLVSNLSGSNQIDKRWLDTYVQMWNIPQNVASILKQFTAETPHGRMGTRSRKRIYLNELPPQERNLVISFFTTNKQIIISDILKGRNPYAADWIMVAQKLPSNNRWTIKPMTTAINHFSAGAVLISPRGNLNLGKVRVQRKGGDRGRSTANKLQFKINPAELFNV